MVIAVAAVGMMKMTRHQIVDMIAMGHGFVPAVRTVHMAGLVTLAFMPSGAVIRIGGANGDGMLIIVIAMAVVEVAVVEVIDMILVHNGGVAAARSMDVAMFAIGVNLV